MSKTLRYFREHLSAHPEQALTELQGWLAAGDREVMKSLLSLKRQKGVSRLQGRIRALLDQIEDELPALNEYLFHYHHAQESLQHERWEEAEDDLLKALDLHRPDYLVDRQELETKLQRARIQLRARDATERLQTALDQQQWEQALEIIAEMRNFPVNVRNWDFHSLEETRILCHRARAHEMHIQRAEQATDAEQWAEAAQEYEGALGFPHPNPTYSSDALHEAIEWCREKSRLAPVSALPGPTNHPESSTMKKILIPIGATLMMAVLIWAFVQYPKWAGEPTISDVTNLVSPGSASSNVVVEPSDPVEDLIQEDLESFEDLEDMPLTDQIVLQPVEDVERITLPENASPISEAEVADLRIAGNNRAGEALTFDIDNYDPNFQYELNLGNGETRNIGKRFSYTYESPGTYRISIKTMNATGGGASLASNITIGERPISTPDPVEQEAANLASAANTEMASPNSAPDPEVADLPPAPPTSPTPTPEETLVEAPDEGETERPIPPAPLDLAEVMPSFTGGPNALKSYLEAQTQFPAQARENEVEGKVYVQFVVNADGSLDKIQLARGIGFGCDEEALRLVRNMPAWNPGQHQGQSVPVRYTLPITFRLK